MRSEIKKTIYYLPGHGGALDKGLGVGLSQRGVQIQGRETRGEFKTLSFPAQIETIAGDLQSHFWTPDSQVVANSYGGYLLLHAQAILPPFPGKLLLLSPIVGDFHTESNGLGFYPPRADRLRELAETGTYPTPKNAEIHVGSEDWHQLGVEYVGEVLDRWLSIK
jgi:hypothetical protein